MSVVKNPPANAGHLGDMGSVPGLRRSLGEVNGNPLNYSRLENPRDRGAEWTIYSPWCHKESDMTEHTYHISINLGWEDKQIKDAL